MSVTRYTPVVVGDMEDVFEGEMRRRKQGNYVKYSDYHDLSKLLWKTYMTLDHGDHDERLEILDKLEKHFEKVGKPTSKS
ncbi:hypothetical protein L1D14_04080 [Vibrio tubiashii]|uniref:hypothetical protein n=1 Tax=Vibrio tubiashii TaxID=29498 RepID=UPI001EFD174F|nr:hypothetical protein [Vibrio tubiashii]MCG9575409.1 hypothetical protein [Vibrio tubiashii]